jgi:hypothetical protein
MNTLEYQVGPPLGAAQQLRRQRSPTARTRSAKLCFHRLSLAALRSIWAVKQRAHMRAGFARTIRWRIRAFRSSCCHVGSLLLSSPSVLYLPNAWASRWRIRIVWRRAVRRPWGKKERRVEVVYKTGTKKTGR